MDINYKALGKRVKIARIQAELTQEQLAEVIHISLTHMSNIETGNARVSLPALVNIANALSVSVDTLLCDTSAKSEPVFLKEASDLLAECSAMEMKMLVHILQVVKESFASYQAAIRPKE